MKKQLLLITGLLFCLSLLCACTMVNNYLPAEIQTIRLHGEMKTVTIPLSYDEKEGLSLTVNMRFKDGGNNPFVISAPQKNSAADITPNTQNAAAQNPVAVISYPADLDDYGFYAEASGNTLNIGTSTKYQFDTDDFRAAITACVTSYTVKGSITLNADAGGPFYSNADGTSDRKDLSLHVTGAMECSIANLCANDVSIKVDGAADISLYGEAQTLSGLINGATDLNCDDLKVKDANVQINGAGLAALYATDTLDAEVNGTGSIVYRGNPTVHKKINGLGTVNRSNDADDD